MDTVGKEIRSKIMSSVGRKNTGPEMALRYSLYRCGIRYRLHDKKLPGSPDLSLPKFHAAIFVHGCFWHAHNCEFSSTPSSRKEYWVPKFEVNKSRDKRKIDALLKNGWRILVLWECALKRNSRFEFDDVLSMIVSWLNSEEIYGEIIG